MALYIVIRHAWLQKGSTNTLASTSLTPLVQSSSPPQSESFCPLLYPTTGLFANWTYKMLSFMACLMRRFICNNLLGSLIPTTLHLYATSIDHFMVSSMLLGLGSLTCHRIFSSLVSVAPRQIHLSSFNIAKARFSIYLYM